MRENTPLVGAIEIYTIPLLHKSKPNYDRHLSHESFVVFFDKRVSDENKLIFGLALCDMRDQVLEHPIELAFVAVDDGLELALAKNLSDVSLLGVDLNFALAIPSSCEDLGVHLLR